MIKHIFFDMDGTLTRSRTAMTREMRLKIFELIDSGFDVTVVSGASKEQILKQIGDDVYEHVGLMPQNGNLALSSIGNQKWEFKLNDGQKKEILHFIRRLGAGDDADLIEDRGCQISYSAIGHNAPLAKKEAYDPEKKLRKAQLDNHKHTISELEKIGVRVAIGGTTCIDFYLFTKGQNVARYIDSEGWLKADCVYIGDALFPGGNDHSVVGVVETIAVADPKATEDAIDKLLDV